MPPNTNYQSATVGRLERSLVAFFLLCAFSLLLVYLIDPSIYTTKLGLPPSPTERYPLAVSVFLGGVLLVIAVGILGVIRHWRWLFWLLLVAFSCSILQIPAILLQLRGVLPGRPPLWYGLLQMSVVLLEIGLALWMISLYRSRGVWAMEKKKRHRQDS